jgi:hypothetical protein
MRLDPPTLWLMLALLHFYLHASNLGDGQNVLDARRTRAGRHGSGNSTVHTENVLVNDGRQRHTIKGLVAGLPVKFRNSKYRHTVRLPNDSSTFCAQGLDTYQMR